MRNLDELEKRIAVTREKFGVWGSETGRVLDDALKAINDLKIEVNQAAATTVYFIPGHHRWGRVK